jgi:UDP:flavonoid glycosyltransferase YjiC (YdhE family)
MTACANTLSARLRVLVTGVPIPGHVIPLLLLARAVVSAGDQVTFAVPASMADLVDGLPILPTGPDIATLLAENDRRTGGADLADLRDISPLAQLFAATRIDMTFDEAVRHARRVHPDLIIADEYDTIGPMLAAALAVPLVQHAIGLPMSPPELAPAIETLLIPRYVHYGLVKATRVALLDPWPEALREPHWSPPHDRLAIRPHPYTRMGSSGPRRLPAPGPRPRVLVTLGTVLLDGVLLDALVDAVAGLDVDVLALIPPGVTHPLADPRTNVRFLGFTPMADLLAENISVVVAAGGAGTVLAALSHGTPMVLLPIGAEKPQNAARVCAVGAGLTITDPTQAGNTVQTLLTDPSYRASAQKIAQQISGMPDAGAVWTRLRQRLAP